MSMRELFTYNAIGWLGQDATMLRYEDLVGAVKALDTPQAEATFMHLFEAAGLASVPDDWRERVRIGSDRKQSGTARENLSSDGPEIPKVLSEQQKAIVEFAAPGLRSFLGYA